MKPASAVEAMLPWSFSTGQGRTTSFSSLTEDRAAGPQRDSGTAEGSHGAWTFVMVRESMAKLPESVSSAARRLAEEAP
jgi:hypothetical protein